MRRDAPLELVANDIAWKPVIALFEKWACKPLGPDSGFTSDEIDAIALQRGESFPVVLREWWRLAGRHPLVTDYGNPSCIEFCSPDHLSAEEDDIHMIVYEDGQTGSGCGYKFEHASMPNPTVYGRNTTIGPNDVPSLAWEGNLIRTNLSIPQLIYTVLLSTLLSPGAGQKAGIIRHEPVRTGLLGGEPDLSAVSQLGLKLYSGTIMIGDVYTNDDDIVYHWLFGFACRTSDAAERVRAIFET